MDLKEWRSKRQAEIELPSGLKVWLKRISLFDLAGAGKIPTTLMALIEQAQGGAVGLSDFNEFAELINLVIVNAIVDPPLAQNGATPDEEHLSLDELDWGARTAIFNICNEAALRLQPFRRESEAALGAALPGGGLQPEAEQLSGDS